MIFFFIISKIDSILETLQGSHLGAEKSLPLNPAFPIDLNSVIKPWSLIYPTNLDYALTKIDTIPKIDKEWRVPRVREMRNGRERKQNKKEKKRKKIRSEKKEEMRDIEKKESGKATEEKNMEEEGERKQMKHRVRVAIRVRPMVDRETSNGEQSCVEFEGKEKIILGNNRTYSFDRVFPDNAPQEEVYETCVKDLVVGCFDGYNAAILAYGQTGSGKTYTMGTALSIGSSGIIPRVANHLFELIKERESKAVFSVKATFLEIYNEQIIDLLNEDRNSKKDSGISIREEKDGSISIYGLVEETANNAKEMIQFLQRGGMNRTVASTNMNEASSRSHAIFTIFLEQQIRDVESSEEGYITAKFFFVDLAGSERAKKTGATGTTLKEGININLGLLELGNVISALATIDKKEGMYITYRNSKLTRILQDCLGGNSNTFMIACISPAESNYEESLNTLKYASKAMSIKNKPVVNRDPQSALVCQLRARITELEGDCRKLRNLLAEAGISNVDDKVKKETDSLQEEFQKFKLLSVSLEKKHELLLGELKEERRRKNELEIQNYELRSEKDSLRVKIEILSRKYPEIMMETEEEKDQVRIVEEYDQKIRKFSVEMEEKQKIIVQLQTQFDKLYALSVRDQKLLVEKNKKLHQASRENAQLRKEKAQLLREIAELKREIVEQDEGDLNGKENKAEEGPEWTGKIENFEGDKQLEEREVEFQRYQEETETALEEVDKCLVEKEEYLRTITDKQIQLEYQLIAEMRQEYQQKVGMLEREKQALLKQKDELPAAAAAEKNKFLTRIDSLEAELKEFRKKIKEQKGIEKVVASQNDKIKELAGQIQRFRMQKIELARKLKEQNDSFAKFKTDRMREFLISRKDNLRKDTQLKKLTLEHKRTLQKNLKKEEEVKRLKKANDTLKALIRPKHTKEASLKQKDKNPSEETSEVFEPLISASLRGLLLEIDRANDIDRYEKKMRQIESEVETLVHDQAEEKLKFERLKLKEDPSEDDKLQEEQCVVTLQDLKERLQNLEESLDFCREKYETLIGTSIAVYDVETEIIYNKAYNSLEAQRGLLKCLYASLREILTQSNGLKELKEKQELEIRALKQELEEIREEYSMSKLEHQEALGRLKEEIMLQSYQREGEQEGGGNRNTSCGTVGGGRLDERERKNYERKILDLTKLNRQISSEVQIWRRKCTVIQGKYASIRNIFTKDKFIGRNREEKGLPSAGTSTLSKTCSMIEEVNQLSETFKNKKGSEKEDPTHEDDPETVDSEFNRNRWDCLGKIDAHSSPVLSLATHANILISTATKNLKIWDLETSKIISDLSGIHLSGFIKCVIVDPQRRLMLTACDKSITLWDLIAVNVEATLKAHKDQIRSLHILDDFLFSAGKGGSNSGGLLSWDLRYLNPNTPLDEKEKNQDIFTLTTNKRILYYGTRNHQVRRMAVDNFQTLSPFDPPHMDTVTGLSIMGNYLVSGSKDKNLRLWSLDSHINNIKCTLHAFNDYINVIQADPTLPVFYSASRDGQVKVASILEEKIQVLGGLTAHTQSVNAICPLEDTGQSLIATASADKTIKIWKPTSDTVHRLTTVSHDL